MSTNRNPHAQQMADESMIRTLAAQARAIWPQEELLFARYGLAGECRIADIGCGSGEITSRLAIAYEQATVIGVDILSSSIAYATHRYVDLAPRLQFEQGDAFELHFATQQFDLVVCRHVTQSIPEPEKVLRELLRVCKAGGWLHVLSEDYGMLQMIARELEPDRLWQEGAIAYARNTGADARIGRRTWSLLHDLGVTDLRVDYVTVDTLRVPRETFATMLEAWRDGYVDAIGAKTALPANEARALFEYVIASIRNPRDYAVWQVPIVSGRKPR
ncbi:MAG TPA: methyltransferase domain-containing protein [Steroidobacteraceae bacterium]